jgi:hypothetical protein
MTIYLAYWGEIDKHNNERLYLIDVFLDKETAIRSIESTFSDVNPEWINREDKGDKIWWNEVGMDIVTIGHLETRTLIT